MAAMKSAQDQMATIKRTLSEAVDEQLVKKMRFEKELRLRENQVRNSIVSMTRYKSQPRRD